MERPRGRFESGGYTDAANRLHRTQSTITWSRRQQGSSARPPNSPRGQEPQIRLAVDVIYPTWLLLDCLKAFADEQPDTRIELYETVLGGTDDDADALRLCSDAWLPEDTVRTELAAGRLVRLPLAQGAERHARTRQACEQYHA